MLASNGQATIDSLGTLITDPGEDGHLVPGPLELPDRTVWWTGRVAIGLLHERRAPCQARVGATSSGPERLSKRIRRWIRRRWS